MGLISDIGDTFSEMTLKDAIYISCASVAIGSLIRLGDICINGLPEPRCLEYSVDEYGQTEVTGNITLDDFKKCYLVEKKDESGKLSLHIVNKDGVDILTNEFISNIHEVEGCLISVDEDIYSVAKMEDYLEGEETELFSPDAIRDMLLVISQNFDWHDSKILSYVY